MYPHERSLVKQLADQPFALVGVNSDRDLDEIREIVKEKNLTWRSFQNEQEDSAIADDWGIQGWPTVFIIDGKGVIRWTGHGPNDKMIEKCIAELTGETVKISHKKKSEKDDDDEKDEIKETDEKDSLDDESKEKDSEKDGK